MKWIWADLTIYFWPLRGDTIQDIKNAPKHRKEINNLCKVNSAQSGPKTMQVYEYNVYLMVFYLNPVLCVVYTVAFSLAQQTFGFPA